MSETGEEAIRRLASLPEASMLARYDPALSGDFSDTTSPTYDQQVGSAAYPRDTTLGAMAIPIGAYGGSRESQWQNEEPATEVDSQEQEWQTSQEQEWQTSASDAEATRVAVPPSDDVFDEAQSAMIATPRPDTEPDFINRQTSRHAAREYPNQPVLTDQGLHSYHVDTPQVEPATEPEKKPVAETPIVRREDKQQERKDKRTEVKDANKGFVESQAAKAGAWLTSWWVANKEFARASSYAISVRQVDKPEKGLRWYKKPAALASYGVAQTGAHISYGARSATQGLQTLARGLFLPGTTVIEVATFEHVRQNAGTLPAAMLAMSTWLLSQTVSEVSKFRDESPKELVGALAREHEDQPIEDKAVANRAKPEMRTEPVAQESTTKAEGYQEPSEEASDSEYYNGTDDEDVTSTDGALPARTNFQYR